MKFHRPDEGRARRLEREAESLHDSSRSQTAHREQRALTLTALSATCSQNHLGLLAHGKAGIFFFLIIERTLGTLSSA